MKARDGEHPVDATLLEWLEEEFDPSASVWVQKHLEGCEECRARAEALRQEESFIRSALAWTAEQREELLNSVARRPTCREESINVARRPICREVELERPGIGISGLRQGGRRGSISRRTRAVVGVTGFAIAASFLLWMVQAGNRLPALDIFRPVPTVTVESVGARPGETVFLAVRVRNIEGPCGLVAKLHFDPKALKIAPTGTSPTALAHVEGEEITIAALTKDGWKGEEGVAVRIPVILETAVPAKKEFPLELGSVRLVDGQKKALDIEIRGGRIKVL